MTTQFQHLTQAVQTQLACDIPDFSPIARTMLAIPPETIQTAEEAGQFLHLLTFLSRSPMPAARAWQWAMIVAESYPQDPVILSLLAALGDQLRHQYSDLQISDSELETLFHRAMQTGPENAGAFARAGLFYLNRQNDLDAERCLGSAFRLDPSNAFVAIQLSDLFARSDRPTEALVTLQQCLANETVEPEILWKAALAAITLNRVESALGYLTQLDEIQPHRRWVQYYRAISLLGLNRFTEAGEAIEREAALINMPTALHVHAVRAGVAAGLDDLIALRNHIQQAVTPPLGLVNYLSREGVVGCFTRLWKAAGKLPIEDPARQQLQARLLISGLTPAQFWDQQRMSQEKVKGLRHFWCDLHQPLDSQWTYHGAMPGEENWKAYTIRYGVLAMGETQAIQHALHWQSHSANLPAKLIAININEGIYTDIPGVTERGYPTQARI
jgi:tetratricopeptide (TPR) repeat protein